MAEPRRALSAEERLAQLLRDRRRLVRERMLREVAGARWRRMIRVTPALFDRAGDLHVRLLVAGGDAVIEALKEEAIFALDTGLRLRSGYGFLSAGDLHVYLSTPGALQDLAARGLVEAASSIDTTLVRPLGGPPRLLAAVIATPPPFETLPSGHRVVTRERLQRELIGAVGARADLFALVEEPTTGTPPA